MAEEVNEKREMASEIVVLANSANFVFNNLKKDPGVLSLSIGKSSEDILSWLQTHLPINPVTVADLAQRYIYLVALFFKEPKEYLEALDALPLDRIEWGRKLAAIIRSRARGTTVANIKIPPRIAAPQRVIYPTPQRPLVTKIIVPR